MSEHEKRARQREVSEELRKQEPYRAWYERLSSDLSEKRLLHSMRVVDEAVELAERFGEDPDKAATAAFLHDCCKKNERRYFEELRRRGEVSDDIWVASPVLHARLGEHVARVFYGVKDPDVLAAIRSHTTGEAGMSRLQKIVFLADLIERGRDFPGVDRLREIAKRDLDEAVLASMDHTLKFLIDSGAVIELETLEARNDLLKRMRAKEKP